MVSHTISFSFGTSCFSLIAYPKFGGPPFQTLPSLNDLNLPCLVLSLLNAFSYADRVVIGKVPRPERAHGDEPFSPQRLVDKLNSQGKTALCFSQAEEIMSHIEDHLQSGDLVLFMSNSGFSSIQRKLAARLQERYEKR